MKQSDFRTRDFIQNAKNAGNDAVILDNVERDNRPDAAFYLLQLTDNGVTAAKASGINNTYYEQWYDFQKNRTHENGYNSPHPEPTASIPQQEFLFEVLQMQKYNPMFPVVVLDQDIAADIEAYLGNLYGTGIDGFQRDFSWVQWGQVKAFSLGYALTDNTNPPPPPPIEPTPKDIFLAQVFAQVQHDYDDTTMCLLIFPRKTVYGGSIYFHEAAEWATISAGNDPLIQIEDLGDAAADDPRAANLLTNGGRATDGWLKIDLPKAVKGDKGDKGDPGENGTNGTNGTDGAKGDKGDKGDTGDTGPTGPKGDPGQDGTNGSDGKDGATKYPPGGRPGSGDSTGGYPPPPPPAGFGARVDTDCDTTAIFSATGTNGSETFASFLGVSIPGWLAVLGVPLPDVFKQEFHQSVKGSIDAAIAGTGLLPASAYVTSVTLCYHWIATTKFSISVFGIESLISKIAQIPKLTETKSNGSTRTHFNLTNDETYEMVKFPLTIPGTDVTMTFEWQVGEATPSQILYLPEYDHTTDITLDSKLYCAFTDFFHNLPTSPILYIGLENFDYYLPTGLWLGHFNLSSMNLHENPNSTGQIVNFSDTPDGLVTGQSSIDYTDKIWTGAEISGDGAGILVVSGDGRPSVVQEALLFAFADGYTGTGADKAYTHCRLVLKYVAGAQTIIMGLHHTSSSAADPYNIAIPGTPAGSTPYVPETHTFDIDVSASNITIGAYPNVHVTLGTGAGGGFYLFEWWISFY